MADVIPFVRSPLQTFGSALVPSAELEADQHRNQAGHEGDRQ